MQPEKGPLTTRLAFFHGLGSIAYGIKDNGFATFLMLYYNQVLGMDSRLVGLALLIALVIDGLIDPVIGYMSDRTYTAWGRRLPWLYLAPVPLGLAWALIWSQTEAPDFWALVGMAVLVRALVSCCELPSVALVPELTQDYDERSTLMRYRFLFGWTGGLLVAMMAYTVFLAKHEDGTGGMLSAQGYQNYGLFGAVLMTLAVLVSAWGQHRRVAVYPDRPKSRFGLATAFSELAQCFSNRAFLVLLGGGALAYISQGITFSISNYLYLFIWRFSGGDLIAYPIVLFLSVLACFVLLPTWHRRWGKRDTATATAVLGMVFWVIPFLARAAGLWPTEGTPASTIPVFGFFFVCNIFSVAAMISVYSMMSDVVEASEEVTGRRDEGAFFSGNLFVQKCGTGLGIFVTGYILSMVGMPDKAVPGEVPIAVIDRLSLTYISLVVVLAVLMALVIRRFPITRADHEARLAALAAARLNPDAEGMHP
ncbi:MFS transporter [Novosphingobium sp. B 225]|uniref:MFS transporter n=1 Tax=Novosphingobium sp. B 225 TaxID=1961849 RepID=UPI000B4B363D|nr:MFS transporter [Novosphingobium sp. B 225]